MRKNFYKPFWRRIIFLSLLINFLLVIFAGKFFVAEEEVVLEDDAEINFVEVQVEAEDFLEVEEPAASVAEQFPEINLPTIKIPEPTLPQPMPQKISAEVPRDSDKPKVISKVLPKDIFQTLINAGLIQERPVLSEGKVIVGVTVDAKGKVSRVQILSGDTGLIKIVAEAAASAWTFETKENPQDFQTQIEFTPADF